MGAFKLRGATNAVHLLDPSVRSRGLLSHSSGNHGQAIAWAAREVGIPATIVMPAAAATIKVEAVRALGADVVLVPNDERESTVDALRLERGAAVIHPFDDVRVISGQGTLALEILDDLSEIDTVLVPVGGGGLISGVGVAVKAVSPSTRVIGVEPELAADARESLSSGRLISWDPSLTYRTIADGTRAPQLGKITFPLIQETVDEIVTVTEEEILAAVATTIRRARLVAEPSGVLSVAAYLADPGRFGRSVAVLSGGNIDSGVLKHALTV
ncbi:threonine/serine dehydratase [Acrocarpospora pleiomorpha]